MEKILLTTGLACLIAGIIGGGLKAFGIEIPVLKTWPRQLALLIFGGLLCFVAIEMWPKPHIPKPVPAQKQEVMIRFAQLGGPFVELGPDKRHPSRNYWWHSMDIKVENRCAASIHVEPSDFILYLSRTASTNGANHYRSEVITRYSKRLSAGWLEPGESVEGRLVFQVPHKLPNGTMSNGAYHIVRSAIKSTCPLNYQPY